MRHPDSYDWPWHPDLQAVFDRLGLSWQVLPPGKRISPFQFGSSPGDAYYTGQTFVFEFFCPPEWVVHELAHWLVCRARRPADIHLKNFGHDLHNSVDDEPEAAVLTCGLERFLDLGDWKATADVLGLFSEEKEPVFADMDDNDPLLLEMAQQVEAQSAPFLALLSLEGLEVDIPHPFCLA